MKGMQNDTGFLFTYWRFFPLNQDKKQYLDLDLNLYMGLGVNKQTKRYLSNIKFDEGHLGIGPWGFYLRKGMHGVVGGGINSSWPNNDWK